ncbi:hypothetical protein HBN50_16780 [Halobacteriovorax sp. GB3]|uniref:hypothetical protein n=1 Tax=Halobacteriovorax sp. GB3 TaxID=2719615 RepID=UPI00235F843A|nr:hypothetical protein [Halobacteriovorax sp. GB3]MDD0854767.1 hypothetical protein [Halobacteriovorax sp. GB3]
MKVLLCYLLAISSSFAAVPTAEGLFRNPNNKDVTGNLVYISMMIKKISNNTAPVVSEVLNSGNETQNVNQESETTVELQPTKKEENFYFKFLINNEENRQGEIIQAEYSDQSFVNDKMIRVEHFKNISSLLNKEEIVERELFYSILSMYSLNDSKPISHLFRKYSKDYLTNKMILNADKVSLLDQYKKYLVTVNADSSLKEHITSPLKSEDEEVQKKINETLNKELYAKSEHVKLVKRGSEFSWNVNFDGIDAYFTNEEHQLAQLKLNFKETKLDLYALDYLLFDGQHEMPKKILIKINDKTSYEVRVLAYNDILSKNKNFNERVTEYFKNLAENKEKLTGFEYSNSGLTY